MKDDRDLKRDDAIIQEAKDRFDRCVQWENDFRKLFIEDLKFANGDSDNGYQWDTSIRKNREIDDRPCLTINKTKQHCFQVINDGRQHAPAIHVHPIDSGATVEAAKLIDGLVRHIEYRSNAQAAYNTGQEFAVFGGIGYWRVTTDYVNDESFDQEIYIRRIRDPLSVYQDPDIKEIDGSDAKFGFIFTDLTKEEFKYKYGEKASEEAEFPLGEGGTWLGKDHIRVAEYFRIKPKKERIAALSPEMMQTVEGLGLTSNIIKESDVEKEVWDNLTSKENLADESVRIREVTKNKVEWFLIAGNKIKERSTLPGRYVPIVRSVGEEIIIDGKLERKGHTRTLKDPQRMYNFWTSGATEHVALQTKIPYTGPARAFAGYEKYWENANNENYAYLPFNDLDDEGNKIERPQREQPPVMGPAFVDGMKIAAGEMMMVSGQYQAIMGQQSNETSGVAINARQRQGDNATYHFIDHQSAAVRFTGRIVVDWLPEVYDTPRILRILGEDGVEDFIHIDPEAKVALAKRKDQMSNEVRQILNPSIGNYDVVVDVGPAYSTRRQEAFQALSQIMGQNQELMKIAGDLLFKAADFPMAQELAERINRTIPAALKEDNGPPPELQQAQKTIQQLQRSLSMMSDAMAKLKNENDSVVRRADADVYRAETERADALHKAAMDQASLLHDIALAVSQMAQNTNKPGPDDAAAAAVSVPPSAPPGAPPQPAAASAAF